MMVTLRICVEILLFFLGSCLCLELDGLGETIDLGISHQNASIPSIVSLSSQVSSLSATEGMEQSSVSPELKASAASTGGKSSPIPAEETRSFTEAVVIPTSSSSLLLPSLLPSSSSSSSSSPSLASPLVTPTVEQLLRIFNNTDTPPDHFLKGIKNRWSKPLKKCYRKRKHGVTLSMYWIPKEGEWDELENGRRVLLNNDGIVPLTPLLDPMDQTVANVSRHLWRKCRMEGTCLLQNGDLINLAQGYTNRFVVIGKEHRRQNIFGWGAGLQNLRPYISVAANDIPLGTTLYVREIDGLELGNGYKHNGCVSVDDDGWSFGGCQLDFFVVSYVDHLWLDRELDLDRVSVAPRKCTLLNYSTVDHLKYMHADTNMDTLALVMNATMVIPNETLSVLGA